MNEIISQLHGYNFYFHFSRDLHKYEPLKRPKGIVSYIPLRDISIKILNSAGPQVRRRIPHPGFTISKWKHDIALLQLKGRIICNRFVSPICLPSYNFAVGRLAIMTISGYGSDDGMGGNSTLLLYSIKSIWNLSIIP